MDLLKRYKSVFQRVFPTLGIICFLLPFLSVKSCSTHEITRYRGYELILHDGGSVYLVSIAIGLLILAASFIKKNWSRTFAAFSFGIAGFLSAAAVVIVILYPYLQFLFDEVNPRIGQIIGGTSWLLFYIINGALIVSMIRLIRNDPDLSGKTVDRFWKVFIVLTAFITLMLPYTSLLYKVSIENVVSSIIAMFFISVPFVSALYFLLTGIKENYKWARVWSVVLAVFVLSIIAWIIYSNKS